MQTWIAIGIVIIFVLVGTLAGVLFPGTIFESVVDSSIGKFFNILGLIKNNYINILESIAVVVFIGILYYVLSVLIKIIMNKSPRGLTLSILMTSILKFLAMIIALILILSAWNVPTPTILAGAGIIGLAVSFGAQGLLEDVFAGLSIIFEKQFTVGDFVEVADFRGQVMEIGARNTRIKNINGNILIIANSDIRKIVNLSEELSFAISEISIEYSSDLDKVEKIITDSLPRIKELIPTIKEGPVYSGVEALGDSAVIIRVIAHCEEKDRINIRRMLNKELKKVLDENGIKIPFPQMVIHQANKE
ncbi:MAG: mechanosensitive ion channel family protein [Candidatus Izimaplasma sp.]|nr:mechanosensitive ion channel family protein [Candidatus Izimaplasma bacterium]